MTQQNDMAAFFEEADRRIAEHMEEYRRKKAERRLTVGKLIEALQGLDPDLFVVAYAVNHSCDGSDIPNHVRIRREGAKSVHIGGFLNVKEDCPHYRYLTDVSPIVVENQ